MKNICIILLVLLSKSLIAQNQSFKLTEETIFKPENKKVLIFQNDAKSKLILFKSNLNVNTDGTPISYHPDDLRGEKIAINTICNAIAVRKAGSTQNLCLTKTGYSEAIDVFAKYRDSNFEQIPEGYTIKWDNVLIPNQSNKPCIISSGTYKGYFSSATSLKNEVSGSDCEVANQVNPLEVPGLVLVGGNDNVLKKNGVKVGDLIVAYNPANKKIVYAVINDEGPADKLGEGTVLLNKMLTDKPNFPKNRAETYGFIAKNIIITVIPTSKDFKIERQYTLANVQSRVKSWLNNAGFADEAAYMTFLSQNNSKL